MMIPNNPKEEFIQDAIKAVATLKGFCESIHCNDCPFSSNEFRNGTRCSLQWINPASYNVSKVETFKYEV